MTRLYRLMLATAAVFGVPSAALADGPGSGEVTGVSVQASPGRADIVINVRGAVEVRDFMLQGPDRWCSILGPPDGEHGGLRRREARRVPTSILPVRPRCGRIVLSSTSQRHQSARGEQSASPSARTASWPGPAPRSPAVRSKPSRARSAAAPGLPASVGRAADPVWDRATVADGFRLAASVAGPYLGKGSTVK